MLCVVVLLAGLRPYSPHLNPIEDAFGEVKAYVRRHDQEALHDPRKVLEDAFKSVTPEQAHSFFHHCGYM